MIPVINLAKIGPTLLESRRIITQVLFKKGWLDDKN